LGLNKPPGLNFLIAGAESSDGLGSVQSLPFIRALRPATFALWAVIAAIQGIVIVTTGETGNMVTLAASTILFAAVHVQFWWEESEQGRRVARSLERARGRVYEDDFTGLPNSRHFVFELRRQMMRSVRNGRGFSLILTDLNGIDREDLEQVLPTVGKALRHACSEGDFIAHLEGPVFACIVVDDGDDGTAGKADGLLRGLAGVIPGDRAASVEPVVSLTGYQGELEVRDFLRRAQRDLVSARGKGRAPRPALPDRTQTSTSAA
jgi:GGDEF domain-containing protein